MRLSTPAGTLHLTYCLNIHPGETWAENREAIRTAACAVRDRLGWQQPFGLGLRLGARAAAELDDPQRLREVARFLDAHNLYAFTINGFPYGTFHHTRVKENVYAPDWTTAERLAYTLRLARILAALVPEGVPGSISTVPGTYRRWVRDGSVVQIAAQLAAAAAALSALEDQTGRRITLALEPEPDCLWDESGQIIHFFQNELLQEGVPRVAAQRHSTRNHAESILLRHLGVCLDTCHQSVLFEAPAEAVASLTRQGIAVPKIQVSAAPIFATADAALAQARAFVDPCYLHQSCLASTAGRQRFPDLPEAIEAAGTVVGEGELRTHFHIPLVLDGGPGFRSSRRDLDPRFWRLVAAGVAAHVEVETYTFGVLPPELRGLPVDESIAAELAWALRQLEAGAQSHGAGPNGVAR